MAQHEESLWWYRGLRGIVLELVARFAPPQSFTLLDAGCGTGGMLAHLARRFPAAQMHGLDYAERACTLARERSSADIRCGSVDKMPYGDASFDVIVSLDVLDADDVDPRRALAEFRRCLRPGGLLVLNLAAYQWLLSWHDRAVGQSRRYSLAGISGELAAAGFARRYGGYWNTLLFPFMVLHRKVWPAGDRTASTVEAFPAPANALFAALVGIERRWIAAGGRLPFGGSVLCVAGKE